MKALNWIYISQLCIIKKARDFLINFNFDELEITGVEEVGTYETCKSR